MHVCADTHSLKTHTHPRIGIPELSETITVKHAKTKGAGVNTPVAEKQNALRQCLIPLSCLEVFLRCSLQAQETRAIFTADEAQEAPSHGEAAFPQSCRGGTGNAAHRRHLLTSRVPQTRALTHPRTPSPANRSQPSACRERAFAST